MISKGFFRLGLSLPILVSLLFIQGCQTSNVNHSTFAKNDHSKSTSKSVFHKFFKSKSTKYNTDSEDLDNLIISLYDSKKFQLINSANQFIGTPYVFGGDGSAGLDCSSLIQNSFANLGLDVPRTAQEQYYASVKKSQPEPGDLLFFDIKNNGNISHVGMYVGNGQMIHASLSKKKVIKTSVESRYWQKRLLSIGSLL